MENHFEFAGHVSIGHRSSSVAGVRCSANLNLIGAVLQFELALMHFRWNFELPVNVTSIACIDIVQQQQQQQLQKTNTKA